MQAHVACLRLLNDIADILAKPDDILLNVDALDKKMEDPRGCTKLSTISYQKIITYGTWEIASEDT